MNEVLEPLAPFLFLSEIEMSENKELLDRF